MIKDEFTELTWALEHLNVKITKKQKEELARFGFNATLRQYQYARIIQKWPGRTSSELLKYTSVSKSTLSIEFGTLIKKGYIIFKSDLANRKIKLVYLTDEGHKLANIKNAISKYFSVRVGDEFSCEEIKLLTKMSKRLSKCFR